MENEIFVICSDIDGGVNETDGKHEVKLIGFNLDDLLNQIRKDDILDHLKYTRSKDCK